MDDSGEIAAPNDRIRERVVLALALLASDACREAAYRMLPPDRWAYTWCRLWFDEVYTPSSRYLDGIKGDRSEEAATHFYAAFSDDERAALDRFHRFLELRVERFDETIQETASIPQTDAWNQVVRDAGYLLEDLVNDPEGFRQQLTGLARVLAERSDQAGDSMEDRLLAALHEELGTDVAD